MFTEAPRDNFMFWFNLNFFSLCLTNTLTMIYFLHYPPIFTRATLLTLNMFSKVPCGQKVINFASWLDINWYGLVRKPRRAIPSRSTFFVPALFFDCRRFVIFSPLYFFPCRYMISLLPLEQRKKYKAANKKSG